MPERGEVLPLTTGRQLLQVISSGEGDHLNGPPAVPAAQRHGFSIISRILSTSVTVVSQPRQNSAASSPSLVISAAGM